jgi:hypothetical protein
MKTLAPGTATALYAAEGCKMNGCEPPFRCETVSQRCERSACGENADWFHHTILAPTTPSSSTAIHVSWISS